jgi:hypothetical protein
MCAIIPRESGAWVRRRDQGIVKKGIVQLTAIAHNQLFISKYALILNLVNEELKLGIIPCHKRRVTPFQTQTPTTCSDVDSPFSLILVRTMSNT